MAKGWTTVALRNDLVARIDAFVDSNTIGITSRGVLVGEVMRRFLETQGDYLTRKDLEGALRAVAATEPATPADLLEGLLRELDTRQGPAELRPGRPHASSSEANRKSSGEASKTDSTKRK